MACTGDADLSCGGPWRIQVRFPPLVLAYSVCTSLCSHTTGLRARYAAGGGVLPQPALSPAACAHAPLTRSGAHADDLTIYVLVPICTDIQVPRAPARRLVPPRLLPRQLHLARLRAHAARDAPRLRVEPRPRLAVHRLLPARRPAVGGRRERDGLPVQPGRACERGGARGRGPV